MLKNLEGKKTYLMSFFVAVYAVLGATNNLHDWNTAQRMLEESGFASTLRADVRFKTYFTYLGAVFQVLFTVASFATGHMPLQLAATSIFNSFLFSTLRQGIMKAIQNAKQSVNPGDGGLGQEK